MTIQSLFPLISRCFRSPSRARNRCEPSNNQEVERAIRRDVFVSTRRNKQAAQVFFSKLLGQYENPSKITTDRLRLYRSVVPETYPKSKHIKGKWRNNRVENPHIVIREREKKLKKFKSTDQARTFLDRFEFIRGYLRPKQHLVTSSSYRISVKYRLRVWEDIAAILLHQ